MERRVSRTVLSSERWISGDQLSISDVASVLLPATSILTVVSLEPSGYWRLFPGPEAESSAEVKNEWRCTSPPPYARVACRGFVNKGKRVAVPLRALPSMDGGTAPCPSQYGTYVRLIDKFAPVLITQEVKSTAGSVSALPACYDVPCTFTHVLTSTVNSVNGHLHALAALPR
jgi:hypothetical protein